MSSFFFSQMTNYMKVLSSVQAMATSVLLDILNEDLRDSKKDVIMYSSVCAVITIASIIMGLWYASSIQQMMAKIQGYAKKVCKKLIKTKMYFWIGGLFCSKLNVFLLHFKTNALSF